ncbi:MAG: class I SAM-dependent methyltransferase, partial [Chloroflexota bacterium]
LGSGGGQQVPILAAAGAKVTSFDNADVQLEKDKQVCATHGLEINIEQGDMCDLSRFDDSVFDLVFHPVSNTYVPDVKPIWRECYRVLGKKGVLLAGFINPLNFLFTENDGSDDTGLQVIHAIPYAEIDTLSEEELAAALERNMMLTWGHTLEDQIGAQLDAGFILTGLYEGRRQDDRAPNINQFIDTYIATRATKI